MTKTPQLSTVLSCCSSYSLKKDLSLKESSIETFTWLSSENKLLFAIGAISLCCKARDPNAIPCQRFHAVQSNMRHRSIYSHHVLDDGVARVFLAVVHVISL